MMEDDQTQTTKLEHQMTEHLTDELANELMNVDFSRIVVPSAEIHSKWESLLQFTQLKVTEELGQKFKLDEDVCHFSFYAYPTLSFDLISCILILNMTAWVIDDHLSKSPDGNLLSELHFHALIYLNVQSQTSTQ